MESSASASASSFHPLLFTFFFCALFPCVIISGPIYNSSILINFTASYLQFSDNSGAGAFLASPNSNFQARITNSKPESRSFYFVIVHVLSNTIIWSANRNRPISESSKLRLTADGLAIYDDAGTPVWSTPETPSPVSSMHLLESGNLILLDGANNSVWESFDSPTDVIVLGQKLGLRKTLISNSNKEDLSEGGYKLVIGDGDAMLQWNGMNYWKLSMEGNAFRDTYSPVEYMVLNNTGVYLMGGNGDEIVMSVAVNDFNGVPFNPRDFKMVKLDDRGVLIVAIYNGNDITMRQAFTAPSDVCKIPYICRRLGVCVNGGSCACAWGFYSDPKISNGGCAPIDTSLVLPGPCNGTSSEEETSVEYLSLRDNLDYFSNGFTDPVTRGVNVSLCQNLCSRNCSCLGVFYAQSSGSCYMVRNFLGSVSMNSGSMELSGFVKAIVVRSPISEEAKEKKDFPIIGVVLSGVVLLTIVAALILMMKKKKRVGNKSFEREEDLVSIPGLPVKLEYQQLLEATDGFKTQIGSGGFATVYKGSLQDGRLVAVKKIDSLGDEGEREFLSEISTIGKIRHVNLVKLEGFCVHRRQRFLIYEFMNRGSLERTLFNGEPALEWKERYKIALGAAKGLAYLHTGCEHKIIHCDVKPENILLNDKLEVKVSDFGLSKLLNKDLSGLFTTLRGTRGYIAPEWLTSTAISDKTDVYSYGMVLLEIIRGMRNFFSGNSQLINFPLLALEMHMEGRYLELMDPRLTGNAPSEEVEKLVRVALCCVHRHPNLRPSMSNVVCMLEGGMALCEPRIDSLIFLRSYSPDEPTQNNEHNEFALQTQEMNSTSSNSTQVLLSYISSQQVSGPR